MEKMAGNRKKQVEYLRSRYITEATPWFVLDSILCMIDLPNLNLMATGDMNKDIKLWDLKSTDYQDQIDKVCNEIEQSEKSEDV